ncbi:alpha/beta fold hydrolase [Methanoculleus sp. FWC-SCC1]|uniref:Alpha/beta fold hydrolase n=1 Tax=Methanoculleus frigidifontis TaxID=2584085 RepID=A0ABT8M7B7_9EURY|nr:alpha/beta fold hydrolase [Methanoculleus sp. FWC-SCC1]MDN7023828.1 alpha/beta fold hydrolase [Methanoculleus sp. FWC-SCC1]
MNPENCPVVLVHGWKSHPGVWKRLAGRLEERGIPAWRFDHSGMRDESAPAVAAALQGYIGRMREESRYPGAVDVVCHSMGTLAARYLFELVDGTAREEHVRHLIGIGPPNNGSSMAELFNDPVHGQDIIRLLAGTFVPRSYRPAEDGIVQDLRPGSSVMAALRAAGPRDDIRYRVIMSANRTETTGFFPLFDGKTWVFTPDGTWQTTYAGDGIIPHADSHLPGAGYDILPLDPGMLHGEPETYCHLRLPGNPEVIERILEYLTEPATRPQGVFPVRGEREQE